MYLIIHVQTLQARKISIDVHILYQIVCEINDQEFEEWLTVNSLSVAYTN